MGRRRARIVLGAVVVLSSVLVGADMARANVPGPAVEATVQPPAGVDAVFGSDVDGDVFLNEATSGHPGAVFHPDGTVTHLARPLAGDGEFGPDGRLWLPIDGSLWAVADDGTMTEYPVVAPEATATTGITVVRRGVDGKVWFLDTKRSSLGSISADGTGLTVFPVAGDHTLQRLARGTDGRMWVTRGTGQVQAVTTTGTVSTYLKVGYPVQGLASNPSGLYATVSGRLRRIAADGSFATVDLPGNDEVGAGGAAVESEGWLWFGQSTAVSPSGRIVVFALPVEWTAIGVPLPSYGVTKAVIAQDLAGGFVGDFGGELAHIADPALAENVLVDPSLRSQSGVNVLHLAVSDRTPGGAARSGTFEVRVAWDRYIPEGLSTIEVASEVVGTITLNGSGTADIPVVPSMTSGLPDIYSLDHGHCCTVYLRRIGVAPDDVTNSRAVAISGSVGGFDSYQLALSPEMTWADAAYIRAIGRSIDDAGALYWGGRLGHGTTRATVARAFVGSATWRRHRVTQAYQRWLRRNPDSGGLAYWSTYLATHTTTDLDLRIARTDAARDALGTTSALRAQHLAEALWLSSTSRQSFQQQLAAGTPWSTLVTQAYSSNSSVTSRVLHLSAQPGGKPAAVLMDQYRSTHDERTPLVQVMVWLDPQP